MKNVIFNNISISNFLSIGKEIKVLFKSGIHAITGYNLDKEDGNGVGKCVDKSTKIDIQIVDNETLKDFVKYLKNK